MRRETGTRHLSKKKRERRKTNRAALAQERPRRIVKRRRGTRCRGRERKVQSDLEINKLGRGGQDGGREGGRRQISRRFPARARGDEGLQRCTAEKQQIDRSKGVGQQEEGGRPPEGQFS